MKSLMRVFRSRLAGAVALSLGVGTTAQATMALNPHGHGQVLIYPYYTVNGNYSTLFTVVNTTANGKALKVRFHEGYDGRGVLDLNVYLAPYAVWTGAVVQVLLFCPASIPAGECFLAAFISNDAACTVPALTPNVNPGSAPGLAFSSISFTGANSDGGPTTNLREAEGHFDVIEMGEIVAANQTQGTLTAITPVNGVPPNCAQVVNAWAQGGYWANNASVDLSPPGGGLYGSENIIDAAQGQLFSINAEAIAGFSTTIQHTPNGSAAPDLNTASAAADGLVHAIVGGEAIQASFVNPVDAISALFMADTVYNTFDIESSLGAMTDWMLAFPTKRFYVDPAIVGSTARVPFTAVFGQASGSVLYPPGTSCEAFSPLVFDRNGVQLVAPTNFGGSATPAACFENSTLTFGTATSTLDSSLTTPGCLLGCPSSEITPNDAVSGHLVLEFSSPIPLPTNQVCGAPLVSSSNQSFCGLPVIGFSATNYVNGNVGNGVLANYSELSQHRTHGSCQVGNESCF
jgi:hypothetical protein